MSANYMITEILHKNLLEDLGVDISGSRCYGYSGLTRQSQIMNALLLHKHGGDEEKRLGEEQLGIILDHLSKQKEGITPAYSTQSQP